MTVHVLAALTWEPQIKGALYVLLAVLILVGSAYLPLSTNMGARLGFLLTAAGLFGFLTTIGIVWWVYGIGPVGPSPSWQPEGVVIGDVSSSRNPALERFPRGWTKLEISDPAVSDALPLVDSQVVSSPGQRKIFAQASEYVPLGAYKKGGKAYGPLGIDIRPLNVFHTPHYLLIQVQKAAPPVVGQPARPDPSAQPVSVLMLRDLGGERRNPAVFAMSCLALFLLVCHQLHTRDRRLAAAREAGERTPEPVSR